MRRRSSAMMSTMIVDGWTVGASMPARRTIWSNP